MKSLPLNVYDIGYGCWFCLQEASQENTAKNCSIEGRGEYYVYHSMWRDATYKSFFSEARNLEYPQPLKNVFYFLQDYILGQPDSSKKSANYLAIVSDIKRNVPD